MISQITFFLIILLLSFGNSLRMLLWCWDEKKRCFALYKPKKYTFSYLVWRVQPAFNIFARFCFLFYLLYILRKAFYSGGISEAMPAILFISLNLMANPIHVHYLRLAPVIVEYLNALIGFHNRAGKSPVRLFIIISTFQIPAPLSNWI
jgi:hypothetical protein